MDTSTRTRIILNVSVLIAAVADKSLPVCSTLFIKAENIKIRSTFFTSSTTMSDLCPVAASVTSMNLEEQPKTVVGSLLWHLKTKKFCDVTFTFPNLPDKIEAHEFCLKTRSPVFEQIFRMRKSGNVQGNEIEITESSPERFQQFLEFIYSDKFEVDIAGALDLLQFSLKYKVHPLTEKCEEHLQAEIPILDSVKVFEAARRHGRRELMDRAGLVMVKSFLELVRADALANAEEETLAYLLECDDLAVNEVGLFQFILDWGRNQVETSADVELLRNKLKNLISKIRYTNMAPEEFAKVVVPTGLLSAEETISVYSYLCVDEITRRGMKIKFNTNHRKVESREMVTTFLNFYTGQQVRGRYFPAFFKQCICFKANRTQVDGKAWPDYFLKKAVISAITLRTPYINSEYAKQHVLNFSVSIEEYSGPVEEGNLIIRFKNKLLNCKHDSAVIIPVEPPVELVSGRTYSLIVEDHSTSDSIDSFRKLSEANWLLACPNMNQEANVHLENVFVTLKEIQRKTDYAQKLADSSEEIAVIQGITIGLV